MSKRSIPSLLLALCFGSGIAPGSGLTIPTTAPDGSPERIPALLQRPKGPGPFPAVVILHDCSGLGPGSSGGPGRWAKELVERGYFVLLPDSFTTRGHAGGVCTVSGPDKAAVGPVRRARDAYAALSYLRTLPDVDGQRIALMGASHGGTTTLVSMDASKNGSDPLAPEKRAGFAAAVALYPACEGRWRGSSPGVYKPVTPLLILIGEKDDWTPAQACRELSEAAGAAGYSLTLKVYPGAYHAFDSPNPVRYVAARVNPNAPGGHGATTGGDPQAWADSIREVTAFLGQHLEKKADPGAK